MFRSPLSKSGNHMLSRAPRLRAACAAALMLGLIAPCASAQFSGINFAATTQFQFDNSGSFTSNPLTLMGSGLTLRGGGFNVFTNGSGIAYVPGGGQNFGIADLTSAAYNYAGHFVKMKVIFTSPNGALTEIWRANLSGAADGSMFGVGGFAMNWITSGPNAPTNNGPNTFYNGSGTVDFFAEVNRVNVTSAVSGERITGDIDAYAFIPDPNAVPEPASLVLFATGLVGVISATRRRGRKT